ncbi:hypothetical protein [Isoptericola dokdonensis]|uniref:Uncharacterized protein n=1 Tax=Isoptericola dokdonensis DS-3 TaxID=1300344 RepID=A0A161HQF8_9MICO|nr:hypothetical protein [Isoptericola dokdonensis]ANC31422.1 hypothetical protein I598_1874 [Isoptericola dokdonensis DS-3]
MTVTLDAATLAAVGVIVTAVGTLCGALIGRRSERDKLVVEKRRVDTEDWKAVTAGLQDFAEALQGQLNDTQGQLNATREELAQTNGRVDVLQTEKRHDAEFIAALQAHILAGKGPPPPTRPPQTFL